MSFRELSKSVFSGIAETHTSKSATQTFLEVHEADLAKLKSDYSQPSTKKQRDYYNIQLLGDYEKALSLYKEFTSNPRFTELINTLSELENRIIKSNSILNLEIKFARQKQKVAGAQKEWLIAKSQFKQEGANQLERIYIGKVLEDGSIEDSDGNVYTHKQMSELEKKAISMCVPKMMQKLNAHQNLESIKEKLERLGPGEP